MIDKTVLAQRIRQLDGLTNEERSQLLELLNEQKRYGLVWEDKEEDVELQLQDELPVLTEVVERRLPVVDGAPNHILIEGDNLHALTCLSYTHENSIDVIYIDPPYNTGNGDFTYNDNIVDEEDDYRFSKWLSFMEKRLRIAKRLLSDTGVLFISIDDYCQAQLKILCDSIFDNCSNPKNSNFVTSLIWNKQHSQQQGLFKKYHEYVLVYAKKKSLLSNVLSEASGIIEAGAMKKISIKNPASTFSFPAGVKIDAIDGTEFRGTYGDSEKVTVVKGPFIVENGKTVYPIVLSAGWTQKKQMESWFNGNETFDTKGQKIIEFYFNSTGKIKCRKLRGALTPSSFLPEFGMGSEQTAHLEDIMGSPDTFTNPKPVEMIKLFAEWFCPNEGRILDFFAGSGTTMEATMQLNKEDGGKRQCILVTNNENGICENVTYERNRRVIQGYTNAKGEAVEGLTNNNLRYYRTEYVPRERSHHNRLALVKAATDLLCIKNDLYAEQPILINGKKLRKDIARSFCASGAGVAREMLIVYEPAAIPMLLGWIKEKALEDKLKVYVFSDNRYAYEDDFKSVLPMIELCALPEAIYKAYQSVRKRKMVTTEALPEQENTEFQLELC